MIPAEEKAKELVDKFIEYSKDMSDGMGVYDVEMQLENSKECALICVEEIKKSFELYRRYLKMECIYWSEVKQEIHKIK